jgi:DNA-directed RNA polymerase subunit beta
VAEKISAQKEIKTVKVVPFISDDVDYLDSLDEEDKYISISSIETDEDRNIKEEFVPVRHQGDFVLEDVNLVTHADVLTYQQAGLGLALIPFVSHDDARRALAGANMQRQGVPLIKQEAPLVGTGVEEVVARQSNWSVFAQEDGEVEFVDAGKVTVKYAKSGIKDYKLVTFYRSNDNTSFTQKPAVDVGQKFKRAM